MSAACWQKTIILQPDENHFLSYLSFRCCVYYYPAVSRCRPNISASVIFQCRLSAWIQRCYIRSLSFYNPNTFTMELKRGDVNVYLNDQLANHYVMDSTINIPKKDTFYVPLNLKISPKLLISSAIRMLMNDNKIKVRLQGSIRVKRGGISFNVPVNYEVMQKMQ